LTAPPRIALAVDPGAVKCGVAVVRREPNDSPVAPPRLVVLHREVVETPRLVARVLPLVSQYHVEIVLVGNATRGAVLARALRDALPASTLVTPIEEAFTSQRARVRFHLENPPRGWRRLVPLGLQTPPRPWDDYVAVLLAEDYFASL